MSTPRISRAVALDQLRQPETDIRERRPQQQVQSLAASMGDPDVGQLQDVLVHPVDPDECLEDRTADELAALHRDGHPMRIVDGETRRLAAEYLGWATLDATIVPEPPESTVVAQLDANTERVDMSGFETVRALYEHYQQTEQTLQDVGEKMGYSPSYMSQLFKLFETPDWLLDAWRHPEHPLETGHALDVRKILAESTTDEYAELGGLDEEGARECQVEDAKLMIDVQAEHDLSVTEFRKRCQRRLKERKQELRDQRTHTEKTADGQAERAEQAERSHTPTETPDHTCIVCGDPADRKIALNVCGSDYGMLSDMSARGETLLEQAPNAEPPREPPQSPDSDPGGNLEQSIMQTLGVDQQSAREAVAQLEQAVADRPAPHD